MKGLDRIPQNIYLFPVSLLVLGVCAMSYVADSAAMDSGEFIVFPTVDITSRNSVNSLEQKNTEPKTDFFYTQDFGNQRILVEALAEPEQDQSQLDVERLQYGWILNRNTDVWIGRFHNPLGFWNTHFHHGAYLETSATRPFVIHFEDDNGILPMHISGIQLNSHDDMGEGGFQYSLGIGVGPDIYDNKLEPLNIIDPEEGSHRLGTSLRLTYQTGEDDTSSQIGGAVAYFPIPTEIVTIGDIKQTIVSLYGIWNVGSLRTLGSLFNVANKFDNSDDDSFTSAYVQSEYVLEPDWTIYGRIEAGSSTYEDKYVALFPQTIIQRQLLGVRYELKKNQALKVEISSSHTLDDSFQQFHVQWSAAIQ